MTRGDRSVARGAVATATAPRRYSRRLAWLVVAAAAALAAWAAGAYMAGVRVVAGAPVTHLTHVHGMDAPAWADGALLVGTHTGLVRWSEERGWRTVGTGRHDLMGFRADARWAFAVAPGGGLQRSRDDGATWTRVAAPISADAYVTAIAAATVEPDVVFVATSTADVLRSADGGASWTEMVVAGEVR